MLYKIPLQKILILKKFVSREILNSMPWMDDFNITFPWQIPNNRVVTIVNDVKDKKLSEWIDESLSSLLPRQCLIDRQVFIIKNNIKNNINKQQDYSKIINIGVKLWQRILLLYIHEFHEIHHSITKMKANAEPRLLWCELTTTMNVTEWQVSWNPLDVSVLARYR